MMISLESATTDNDGTPSSVRCRGHRRLSKAAEELNLLREENDDDAERKERQRNKILELQQNLLHSPCTPSKKRVDLIGTAGLSNAQLAEHYKNCIKLNNENKINAKNAFDLHLIDCMGSMLKEKDSDMTNFQMASCSLDASAKIYAYRVDSVHSETYRIASGILGTIKKKSSTEQKRLSQANEEEDNEPVKKKIKKKPTIEQNVENLRLNVLERNLRMDPMLQKIRTSFDEGGTNGLLLNVLDRDECDQLILDSSYPAFPALSKHVQIDSKSTISIAIFKDIFSKILEKPIISPEFHDFTFLNWSLTEQEALNTFQAERNFKTKYAIDLDDIPEVKEDESESENPSHNFNDFDEDDLFQDNSSKLNSNVSSSVGERQDACKRSWKVEKLSDVFSALSLEPSEYSHFDDKFISAWAGPGHWNVRSSVTHKTARHVRSCPKQPKEVERLNFNESDDFGTEENLKLSKKSNTLYLTRKTLNRWNKLSTTLPPDLHYDAQNLYRLFLKPKLVLQRKIQKEKVDSLEVDDYDENDYGHFCPSGETDTTVRFEDVNKEAFSQTALEQTCLMTNDTTHLEDASFFGNNLVQQPFRIPKSNVAYAKKAKKINVKRLKSTIWDILSSNDEEHMKERSDTFNINFTQMYENLRHRVSGTTVDDLTPHIAFVCLLYLANEKNLQLMANGTMQDFMIQGNTN